MTREQVVDHIFAIGIRNEDEGDRNFSQFSTLISSFTDADSVQTWAVEAMNWAVSEGIINGMGDGTVAPQGTVTRAQGAQILYNMRD